MAAIRSAWSDWRKYLVGIFTQVLANPVIGRELRVRVRVGRAYLLQAAYLAFLILVVGLAYEWVVGDESNLGNPFQMQQALVGFYWVVVGTLIGLIALIAPALTANAVTLERERKTMDLLLATPLTARHLLTGKLIGSFAFIVLLLALTLPVSAVSVLLGGVSFGDLLRAYVMIAFGGLTLCAIALFTSVYARNSTMAVLWSYVRVGVFLLATGILVGFQSSFSGMPGSSGGVNWGFPAALLNPFAALIAADTHVDLKIWQVPTWIMCVVLCLLFTRLVLTGAAQKVGLYDKDVMPSLRRQLLLLTPLYVLLTMLPMLSPVAVGGATVLATFEAQTLTVMCMAPMLLLAGWIAPFGDDEDKPCPNDGVFRVRKLLTDAPSGALPFLSLLWLLMLGALYASFLLTGQLATLDPDLRDLIIYLVVYFTGAWVLLWGVGRFCSVLLNGRSLVAARALSLATITAILTLPVIAHLMFYSDVSDSPALSVWVATPFIEAIREPMNGIAQMNLLIVGGLMLAIGLLLGALTRPRRER